LVNFTAIHAKMKESSSFDDAFPRWVASSRLVDPNKPEVSTAAVAIIGDSRMERDIGVAQGFTTKVLQRDEIMVPEDML